MEQIYAALLLHKSGKEISEAHMKKVLEAAGSNVERKTRGRWRTYRDLAFRPEVAIDCGPWRVVGRPHRQQRPES